MLQSARRNKLLAFAFAAFVLGAAVALRFALDPWMGDALPLVTLFGAVAGVVWVGGAVPAALTAAAGYAVCAYLFIEPRGTLGWPSLANFIGLAAYAFTCSLIVAFGEAARRSQGRASERGEVLRVTLRSIGDAVITTDTGGRVNYMNAVAESLTGWSNQDAVGHPLTAVFRIVNEDTREPVEDPAATALRDGRVVGLANHTILLRRDGGEVPIDDSAAPISDDFGDVSGCVLVFRDVTRQRAIERDKTAQLSAARMLAAIIETTDDAIISKSLDGIIQSWNAGAERLFGYAAEQAVGRHISLVIPHERLDEEDRIIASLKAGQRIDHFETERVRADGVRIQVSLTISPLKDEDGRVVGASKIVRDVTERRKAEADRQMFVTLVESSTDFIGMCDLQGVPFFVNRAGLELVGLADLDAARRTPVASFFFPEDQARMMNEFFPQVLAQGRGETEVRFRHFKTGEARWMAYKVLALPGRDGKPTAFATVSQDITEQRRMEDSLRKLAADLSEADRRKNEFLAMLAHELRNPLAPISNAARALCLGARGGETLQAASEMLERQVGQMARLVDDLLDMSRITRGRIELRRHRVELAPIVEQAVEAVRAQYRNMQHELTVSLPPGPVYLDADPARLAQVISNLLTNAYKFTDSGGRVWLTIERIGDEAVIRVRDTGIGVDVRDLPRLFDMFAQVDTSLERSRDGLGIGLTLVKTLVELHGGGVEAHSDGLGRGSEFTVRLPVLAAAERPAPVPPPVEAIPTTGRRVLIVDDNEDGAESLAMLLELGGHETHKAHDGLAAMEAAERLRPDALLLDIGLPKLNGYEVCSRIRKEPWGRELLMVALTGWGQDEDRHRSREAGFDAHIVKPVDPGALLALLASSPAREVRAGWAEPGP